jgi:hypothetical protein
LHPEYFFQRTKLSSNIEITEQTGVTLMLLTHIWGVPGLNLIRETDYPDTCFAMFLSCFMRMPREYLNAMTYFFQIINELSILIVLCTHARAHTQNTHTTHTHTHTHTYMI